MSQLNDDTTLIMTLTRTATFSNGLMQAAGASPSQNPDGYISWIETTIATQSVMSIPVTYSRTQAPSSVSSSVASQPQPSTKLVSSQQTTVVSNTSTRLQASSAANSVQSATSSTYSPHLQFGDVPTSNSNQVGIAVGVPIAVFAVFFIALGAWYYMRIRKSKQKQLPQFKSFTFSDNAAASPTSSRTISAEQKQPYPVLFSPSNYLKTAKDLQDYRQEQSTFQRSMNRLSRMWPVRDREREMGEKNQANEARGRGEEGQEGGVGGGGNGGGGFVQRMSASMMTPIFLKKFKLGKITEEKPDSVRPQILKINGEGSSADDQNVLNRELYIAIRSYTKKLSDELTLSVGDKCTVLEKHSDGWFKVRLVESEKSLTLNETGFVPRMCLQKI
ncbi:uncharacterized protein LODBEIA_P05280 [Lodderomyces beijingensis]|uniref:SH3 domain-containing protein n=1 Tax=Lodderomyces beijingensis TaxID=1775926 RepID=A0ABP0ZEK2_9ASCO